VNRLVTAILPLGLLSAGCSVLLDPGEKQCETAKDCAARGFMNAACVENVCEEAPMPGPWDCLGHVVEPTPDPSKMVALSVRLANASDKSPVTVATVDVCDKLDVNCLQTSSSAPKGLSPDSKGYVNFSVPQGFDGFVRIDAPGIMASRVFVGRPIVKPPAVKEVRLVLQSDYQLLAAAAGQNVDAKRGTAILYAVDCNGLAASGVRFETPNADANSQEFYLVNQIPTAPPTATTTDVDGFGGYFNLPPGISVAQSYLDAKNAYIGESSFQVLENTISYVQISPTPK
jgi:hypothetical protein